jgi:intein/homing endonuclease
LKPVPLHENVVRKFKNWAEKYFIVDTDLGDSIKVTGKHMFWIEDENKWEIAKKLNIGDVFKTQNGVASATDIIRIDNIHTDTFNLEILDCHNYLAGVNGVLVHNKSKISKFESNAKSDVEFYRVTKDGKTVYIGQTTQGIGARFGQHVTEGKRKNNIKADWKDGAYIPQKITIPEKEKMTPYEAHVWEKHLIDKAILNDEPLQNKANPISEIKYNKFQNLEFNNPCQI